MSILQYPDAFNAPELQIWNNAAFDNGESEDLSAIKGSWCNLESPAVNHSLESDCSKENQSPVLLKSSVPLISVVSSTKPLCSNNGIGDLKEKSVKGFVEPFSVKSKTAGGKEEEKRDEKKIDMEIEEIEKEISRLSSKLEALRLEKAEHNARSIAMRGRVVPAKFMEARQSFKKLDALKKFEDPLFSSSKAKLSRRGVSMGPSEIFSAVKSRQSTKQGIITPVQSIQSRRKSCFFKLQDIDEGKATRERGKSLSLSPKSRKTVSKVQAPKQAATTVGSKRPVKKEDGILGTIQPKRLFRDGEKSAPPKKPLKAGRTVASRYNQIPNQSNGSFTASEARKRSFPENDKEENSRVDKRRASRESTVDTLKNQRSESRVKKRWEIPSEVMVFNGGEGEGDSPNSADRIGDVLPKIRTLRCVVETPRDSGAAKRVAELVGKKSYFCTDEEAEDPVCQALSFVEEEEDDIVEK